MVPVDDRLVRILSKRIGIRLRQGCQEGMLSPGMAGPVSEGGNPARSAYTSTWAGAGRNRALTSSSSWLLALSRRMTSATATPRTPASVMVPWYLVVIQRLTRAACTAAQWAATSAAVVDHAGEAAKRSRLPASAITTSSAAWYWRSRGRD